MARPIEVPVVVKKGSLSRSIEGEATAAMHKLGRSSGAVAPLGRMLGKIRADADEFTKSIEASNARVIAFGASVGVINGISNAFKSLVATTIKVEKSMADINIVLGASQSNLAKFGDGLFKVAKNTAQSFDVVAEAATEFARQGLSIEETLKRTNDALILTRLTGLKAAESVKGLTAAVNGFGKAGLTTTQIINKLSAVDVQFAVGTDDLIDALSRAGAVAQDAGVSFDELVALVTVAQQRTARGGAVIGNAFKTIYTRIQDPKALAALRSVKIAVDDVAGAALPANRVLQNLAQSYDGLNRSQKATIDQFVAGKFQINILKSVLGDLSTVNNEYNRAQQVSANATDQAIQKNQQLNKTLAALATQGGVAIEELAKKVGDISLGPGMRNIITTFNELVEGMTRGLDGEGTGATFAKGLLKGVGGILTGPGLVLVGGVFIKLFKDLTVFGVKSLKNLLGLNNASKQQAALQQGIGQLLATNLKFQQAIAAAEGNTAKQAAITSRFLAQEVAMRERAAAATSRMAAGAFAGGFGVSSAGLITRGARRRGAPSFAPTGGIPNFASITDYIQNGVFNVGQMPEVMTGSTTQFGKQTDGRMPIDTFFKQAKLGSQRKGFTKAGAELRRALDAHGVTHVQGHVRANNLPFSDAKGALSFYDQAFNVGPATGIRIQTGGGAFGRGTTSLANIGRQMMIDNPTKYGMSPTDAFMDAVKRHKASILASGVSEPQLRSFYTGSGGTFERAIFAGDSSLKPYGHANFMFDAARDMGGGKFRQMDVKSRLNVTQFASLLAKKMRTMDLDEVPLMNIEKDRKHFQGQALKPGTFEARMSARPGFKFGRFIRNFAPLGDAIQREKMQVGAMMGISPSNVQTRVVQNTALKSPFNPQGFGVISPTVGQHSFADAQRMHRGEDLRTTNLPNFSIGGGGSRMDPFTGKMTHASVVDPGGTAKGTLSVKVEDYSDKALKKSEGALERRSRLSRGTSFAGMTGKAGDVAFGVPMRERVMRRAAPIVAGAKGIGSAAMGPVFTGMFASEMAGGFFQDPELEELISMTPGQRRSRGRGQAAVQGGIAGGTAGYLAAQGLKAVKLARLATPVGIATTIGGAAYGALSGGNPTLTASQLGAGAQLQRDKATSDIDRARQLRTGIMQAAGESPDARAETLSRMQELSKDITDPEVRKKLQKALTSTDPAAEMDTVITELVKKRTTAGASLSARAGIISAGKVRGFTESGLISTATGMTGAGVTARDLEAIRTTRAPDANQAANLKLGLMGPEVAEFKKAIELLKPAEFEKLKKAISDTTKSVNAMDSSFKNAVQTQANVYSDFQAIRDGLLTRKRSAELSAATFQTDERTTQLGEDYNIAAMSRVGGAVSTIGMRTRVNRARAARQNKFERSQLVAQAGVGIPELKQRTPGANLQFMQDIEARLKAENVDTGGLREMIAEARKTGKFGGNVLQVDVEEFQKLDDWAKSLDNSVSILDASTEAQYRYIAAQEETAKMLQKDSVLLAGLEGFKNSLKQALMSIGDPSLGGGDIARNFAMGILGSINQQASANVADAIGGKLGKFFGLESQRGAFVPGSGTGDKVHAMVEPGEYILNQKATSALGRENLDAINFGMFPRFQTGGGVFGGVSSRHRKKALEKFRYESLGPTSGGSVLGGGGIGLNLGVFDKNLSSLAMDDPMAQATRGFLRQERQKDIQKQFAKQAKRDQLTQAVVGTAISVGLNAAVNKLGNKPDYGDVSGDPPEGFVPPDMAGYGPDGYPADPAGPVGFGGSQAGASKRFGMLGPLSPPQTPNNIYTRLADRVAAGATLTQAMKGEGLPTAGHQGANPQKTGTGVPGMSQIIRNQITANRGIAPQSRKYGRVSRSDQLKLQVDALRQLGGAGQQVTPFPEMVGDAARSGLSTVGKAFSMIGKAPAMLGSAMSKGLSALMGGHRSMYDQLNPMIIDGDSNRTTRAFDEVYSTDQGYIGEIDGKFYIMQQHKSGKYGRYPSPLLMNRSTLMKSLNGKKIPGYQRGGSVDNIPAMLTGGEFVVNAGAVKRYGSNTLQHMNRGGMVGNQKFVPGDQNGSAKSNGEAGTSNTNNTVSISVNMGANGSASISEDASGSTQDSARGARDLGRKIRDAVRSVIDEEKRVGGSLRNPYAREQ